LLTKGLSGGERKRTSIGVELITDPFLLFLDEPTSGLDSENSFQILKKLKNETRLRGSAVLCTLHQPSSQLFALFDRVICLSEGHAIYNGHVSEIKEYTENILKVPYPKFTNPSDFLIKLAISPQIVSPILTPERLK